MFEEKLIHDETTGEIKMDKKKPLYRLLLSESIKIVSQNNILKEQEEKKDNGDIKKDSKNR